MLSEQTIERIIELLAPDGWQERSESETLFPARQLPGGAEVMRVPPSPTGFVHIGTIYAGLINDRIAHQTDGVFILRIEDTDKKREVEGSLQEIVDAFKSFELNYDEGPERDGSYGPYSQSQRGKIYLGYAVELLKNGWAYPCFATGEELKANMNAQQAAKLRPGYYGKWALWRDKTDAEVSSALDANKPFVLRFRSRGNHEARINYEDVFKGHMEVPENDLDVPLIKSDEYRLPTYHLAHVVDDHLMRITKVFRSDEWLPSTALHIELAQALGITPFTYGHFAPISIIEKSGGGKRKLSKRKDDEANVQFWLKAGYPVDGVKAYLLGLANSNFEEWYRANPASPLSDFHISLEKLAASRSPLLDMTKLEDYCKDYIANLSQQEFKLQLTSYVEESSNPEFNDALKFDAVYTDLVLEVERDGDKPRKDLAKWSDAYEQYGYFFDSLYESDFSKRVAPELKEFDAMTIQQVCEQFLASFSVGDEREEWFTKLKVVAQKCGFAEDMKIYKANPEKYKGSVADAAKIIRVKLSGKNRTPDLWSIMQIMQPQRVTQRLL